MTLFYFNGGSLDQPHNYQTLDGKGQFQFATSLPTGGDEVIGAGQMFGSLSVASFQTGTLTSGDLSAGIALGLTAAGGTISAGSAPNGALATTGGAFKVSGTITNNATALSGGSISAHEIDYAIADGAGSSITADLVDRSVGASNGATATVTTATGASATGGGTVSVTKLIDNPTTGDGASAGAGTNGVVTAGTISTAVAGDFPVTATSGGTVNVGTVVSTETDGIGPGWYISVTSGGLANIQNLYSTGVGGVEADVNGGTLVVGQFATANKPGLGDSISISNGGTVDVTGGIAIGSRAGDSTIITVDAGSRLILPGGKLLVGDAGSGYITMNGVQSVAGGVLGAQSGSSGFLSVSETADMLTVQGDITAGDAGFGQLGATAGIILVSGGVTLGNKTTGNGVIDAFYGGTVTVQGLLVLGNAGSAHGEVRSGRLNAPSGLVAGALVTGNASQDQASLEISDPGAELFTNGAGVTIGDAGHGSVSVEGGATLDAGGVVIANQAGSGGGITLTALDPNSSTPGVPVQPSVMQAASLVVGRAGQGAMSVNLGSTASIAGTTTIGGTYGSLGLNGGTLHAQGGIVIADQPSSTGQLIVANMTLGAAYVGELDWAGLISVGDQGNGSLYVTNTATASGEAGALLVVSASAGATGFVSVTGTGALLAVPDLQVGSATLIAVAADGTPSYSGAATGSVFAGSGGSISVAHAVTLQTVAASPSAQASGLTVRGGRMEIGGSGNAAAGQLLIDAGALLIGHGGVTVGTTTTQSVAGTITTTFNPGSIVNNGSIEVRDGLLLLQGDVNGTGTLTIDEGATLELGGDLGTADNPDGTVDFQGLPDGTLSLDDLADFHGNAVNLAEDPSDIGMVLSDFNIEQRGSRFIIHNSPTTEAFQKSFLSEGTFAASGSFELQVNLGVHASGTIDLPDATPSTAQHFFFKPAQTGTDTVLSYTAGNPIDRAVDGPNARHTYSVTGNGIIVGIISNGFDASKIGSDQAAGALPSNVAIKHNGGGDEGRAMAQIVHDIAPDATIYFYSAGGTEAGLAAAIAALQTLNCNIIVDDELISNEPNHGSSVEQRIDAAVGAGITYVTATGNERAQGLPIFGHAADPMAISVAAMNWLATPKSASPVGGYLPTQTEPFSSVGTAKVAKPNLTAPDGGPTTLPLDGGGLSPFFGTSAAAPAVAGIAALMLQANRQLKPADISAMLGTSATPDGEPFSQSGAGLAEAYQAVGRAKLGLHNFYVDPPLLALHVASAALSQPGGDAAIGSTVQALLSMSAPVNVTGGTPTLDLNDGGAASYDAAASDLGSGSLVFDYVVAAGQATPNLAITAFDPHGATIQDAIGDAADFSGVIGLPTGVSINSPLVVSALAASQSGEVQPGQTVAIGVTLNAAVTLDTNGGPPTLTLSNSATAGFDAAASNLSAGTLAFDYAAGPNDATPDLSIFSLNLPAASTIRDATGYNADFSAALDRRLALQIGPAFVNLLAATPTGALATGHTVQITVTMTQPVTLDASAGVPSLALSDGAAAVYDAAVSAPAAGILVFDYAPAAGEQAAALAVSQFNTNGAVVDDLHGVPADFSGLIGYPTGITVNSPTMVTGVAAVQTGIVHPGQTVTLALGFNAGVLVDNTDNPFGPPTLSLDDNAVATYDSAASSADSLVFDYVVGSADSSANLTVTGVNLNGAAIHDAAGNTPDFSAAVTAATGLQVACLAEGTLIETALGPVCVEALRIGQPVRSAFGGVVPVCWIGWRRIACAGHPDPTRVRPVRVCAHTFAPFVPARDVLLSPDHAVYVDGVLIPVRCLIDDVMVRQETLPSIHYFHVELPQHDVMLAEGMPVETYLDTGNRGSFANGGAPVTLHADFAREAWEAGACAPQITHGPLLGAARRRLALRALALSVARRRRVAA